MRPRALIWVLVAIAAVAAARRWLDVVEVRGNSMAPTLLPGDRLLVVRARPGPGDIVLAPDPRHPTRELIKRVHALGPDGVVLRGDNLSASSDASVAPDVVRWRVVLRYWPLHGIASPTRRSRGSLISCEPSIDRPIRAGDRLPARFVR